MDDDLPDPPPVYHTGAEATLRSVRPARAAAGPLRRSGAVADRPRAAPGASAGREPAVCLWRPPSVRGVVAGGRGPARRLCGARRDAAPAVRAVRRGRRRHRVRDDAARRFGGDRAVVRRFAGRVRSVVFAGGAGEAVDLLLSSPGLDEPVRRACPIGRVRRTFPRLDLLFDCRRPLPRRARRGALRFCRTRGLLWLWFERLFEWAVGSSRRWGSGEKRARRIPGSDASAEAPRSSGHGGAPAVFADRT